MAAIVRRGRPVRRYQPSKPRSTVNQYRIEHAKALLSHHEHKNESVLDIAFMVGFNSNSAFYSAFRKAVGQSPAQFRRSRLK